jgi:uncharacterized integral membrane protein (TIGR00697 family)
MRQYKFFDIIMAAFVAVLIISNIASSAKIVDLGFGIFGVALAFDAGTILFPISYIFGDILTEVYGYKNSRRVIWTGFVILALSAGVFWIIQRLPGESTWQGYAGDTAYSAILGGMSTGGIVFASLAGYWSGEFSNSNGRWLWTRTIGSTLVGELVDSVAFVGVATLFGVFPISLFWTLTITNYLFKVALEVAFTPVTYFIVGRLKKTEHEDYYDRDTIFNPFRIS